MAWDYGRDPVSKGSPSVGNVLPETRWLILSSAYKSWQSMMVSHRAVDQLHSWDSVKLINCCMRYHNGLSGLICRAFSQPPSYKETFSFRTVHTEGVWSSWIFDSTFQFNIRVRSIMKWHKANKKCFHHYLCPSYARASQVIILCIYYILTLNIELDVELVTLSSIFG